MKVYDLESDPLSLLEINAEMRYKLLTNQFATSHSLANKWQASVSLLVDSDLEAMIAEISEDWQAETDTIS